jgi:hypothetical protein
MLVRYGEKESLIHCWWECKLVQPPWKAVQRLLKKLKMDFFKLLMLQFNLTSLSSNNLSAGLL